MNWQKPEKKENDTTYKIPDNWLLIHYYEALNVLFRFENTLRLFIYVILKKNFKKEWLNISLTTEDGGSATINSIAKRRKSVDDNYGYIGYDLYSPMLYLTSGELVRIILADSYWKLFNNYFPGAKEVIKNKLDEIGNIRNDLAHFRPIREDDVEVVKQNVKHILSKIEEYLFEVLNIDSKVPSNCEENWFVELRQIANDYCSISFYQNNDFIKIFMKYKNPITKKFKYTENRFRAEILTYDSINLINRNPDLIEKSVYITENIPFLWKCKNLEDDICKGVCFVFSKETLEIEYSEIKSSFYSIIQTLKRETELLLEDNSARGIYIFPQSLSGVYETNQKQETAFSLENWQLSSNSKNAPIEYWGSNPSYWNPNIVSDTDIYPWMQVSVCNNIPF